MQHSKQHIIRKLAIVILTFFVGIMTTIVTAVTYDSTVETRANSILNVIKSNASNMTPADVSSYYALVRMNIKTLMVVLTLVDENLTKESIIEGTIPSDIVIQTGSTNNAAYITKSQRDSFMEETKSNLNTRINEDDAFVYIDGELAISKAKYNHKDFGKSDLPYETVSSEAAKLVCPTGYDFARVKPYFQNHGDYSELDVSPLTLETLGYYVNQVANGERILSTTSSAQQKVTSLYKTEIVDDKYRLTSKIYDGSFLGSGLKKVDVCTQEFGHQWQVSNSQAGLDAVKKFTDTAPDYERIWKITSSDLKEKTSNNCYGFSLNGDGKGTTYKQKRSPNEWSESCNEKAYVVCENNGKPDKYNEDHLSFTGVRIKVASSSGINPIKHISETGVAYWSAEIEDVISTSFFVAPTNVNQNFGGWEGNTRYWSGRMQMLHLDLTKAGPNDANSKYSTYNTRVLGGIQSSINPVLCQKSGTISSKNYPGKVENGKISSFPKVIDSGIGMLNQIYFHKDNNGFALDDNMSSTVLHTYGDWDRNLAYKDQIPYYRNRGRQFLIHTFQAIQNYENFFLRQNKNQNISPANLDYYFPIWDNGYYFPVSEKK